MPKNLVEGLRQFRRDTFPEYREHYRRLVDEGQKPGTLLIGCSDSRVVPDLLLGTSPGDLFVVRNVGAFVPPFEADEQFHGTSAAIEYAVLVLGVTDIVVCGHSHCGAVRALYDEPDPEAPHIRRWLSLGRPARMETDGEPDGPTLRRSERRNVAVQLERLLTYPMVRDRAERGDLSLHGWLYVIEDGQVLALDVDRGEFSPLVQESVGE